MYLRMNIHGVKQHIFQIDEELKKLDQMKQAIYSQMQEALLLMDQSKVSVYERCLIDLDELEKDIRNRKIWLEETAEAFHELYFKIDEILDL